MITMYNIYIYRKTDDNTIETQHKFVQILWDVFYNVKISFGHAWEALTTLCSTSCLHGIQIGIKPLTNTIDGEDRDLSVLTVPLWREATVGEWWFAHTIISNAEIVSKFWRHDGEPSITLSAICML